jgi:hypothetical protein
MNKRFKVGDLVRLTPPSRRAGFNYKQVGVIIKWNSGISVGEGLVLWPQFPTPRYEHEEILELVSESR